MYQPTPAPNRPAPIALGQRRRWPAIVSAVTAASVMMTIGAITVANAGSGPLALDNGPDGVAQIYPTKPGGQTWFMDDDPEDDPRFDPGDISQNSDGSWRSESGKVRMNVRTTSYTGDEGDLVWRQDELRDRGFMFDANDWRDVEMTGYVKLNDADDEDEEFTWYTRGARHTGDDSPPEACWGTAYKGSIGYDSGQARFDKEVYHVGYGFLPWEGDFGSIEDKWIGFKVVMYNLPDGSVKLESYADLDNTNQWEKVYDHIDDGGWSIRDSYPDNPCDGPNDQVITWGGPIATFRWDDANSVDFTKFSVREIDADGDTSPSPTPTASPTTPPGGSRDLPVSEVTASEHDGNVPGNTRDDDPGTRWSAEAINRSEWIRYDLGAATSVHHVKVAWYRGDERNARYQIEVSDDGSSWRTVQTGRSSGATTELETYDFADTTGRFLRITSDGNSDNDWVSITEVKIVGGASGGGTKDLPVSWVDASSDDGNVPGNTRDGDLTTRWSAEGNGEWIRYDLGETDESIHYVKIAWYRGDERRARFDVQASADGSVWDTLLAGQQASGTTTSLETYDFPDTASQYRYVRVVGHGNTDNDWNSISEVRAFGCCSSERSGPNARVRSDYDEIESLLFSMFGVGDDEVPTIVDDSYDADIDNYYATAFIRRTGDGREHELVRYRPRDGGETVWGWTYERYREGPDRYHQAHKWLTYYAQNPPLDSEVYQQEELQHDSYHGRIWCWYGRDMVMITNQMILGVASIYGWHLRGAPKVFLDLVGDGAKWVVDDVYGGDLPEHDYCTENGYIR